MPRGRSKRATNPEPIESPAIETSPIDEPPSIVLDDDLRELEALASSPCDVDIGSLADKADAPPASFDNKPKDQSIDKPRKPIIDKEIIQETLGVGYLLALNVADKVSGSAFPGNKMTDIVLAKPGYQKKLDRLLFAVAEEYGVSEHLTPTMALLLFTLSVYREADQ